jgi:hypothetical protein
MDELSLHRVFRFHQVRHQERLKELYRSAAAQREGETRVNDARHVLWKQALECSSTKQGSGDRRLLAHRRGILEQASAELQRGMQQLKERTDHLGRVQEGVVQSEAAGGLIERMWRSRVRKDALRLDEEQGDELIGLAGSRQAVTSRENSQGDLELEVRRRNDGHVTGVGVVSLTDTVNDEHGADVVRVIQMPATTAPFEAAQESRCTAEDPAVAVRIEQALPSGDTVSIEVRQREGAKLDATIAASDGVLVSTVAKEKKLLLARLDAACMSIDTLTVVSLDPRASGVTHRMRSRRRMHDTKGDDDEIAVS